MSLEDLLNQVEEYRKRREGRDQRPTWLREFIESAAEMFEPLGTEGRVGFDCRPENHGWTVVMYLGATEMIGGPNDGYQQPPDFSVNLDDVRDLFSDVNRMEFYATSAPGPDDPVAFGDAVDVVSSRIDTPPQRSLVAIHGEAAGGKVRLELHASSPGISPPGFRRFPNGTIQPS